VFFSNGFDFDINPFITSRTQKKREKMEKKASPDTVPLYVPPPEDDGVNVMNPGQVPVAHGSCDSQ